MPRKDWSDYLLEGIISGADFAQKRSEQAFKKWQVQQESDPEAIKAKALAQIGIMRAATGADVGPDFFGGGVQAQPAGNVGVVPPQPTGASPIIGQLPKPQYSQLEGSMAKKFVGLDPRSAAELDMAKDLMKKTQGEQLEVAKSKMQSQYNMQLVAENLSDYSQLLAQSWKEGGAGDIFKQWGTTLARKGFVVGDVSKYKTSGAIVGKLFEITGKQFPMISQQISKEGSVRLLEGIFSRLEASYPSGATPPEMAPRMITETLKSIYRVRRAMDDLDINRFNLKNEKEKKEFSDEVVNLSRKIKLSPEEEQAYKQWSDVVLAPMMPELARRELARRKKGKR